MYSCVGRQGPRVKPEPLINIQPVLYYKSMARPAQTMQDVLQAGADQGYTEVMFVNAYNGDGSNRTSALDAEFIRKSIYYTAADTTRWELEGDSIFAVRLSDGNRHAAFQLKR